MFRFTFSFVEAESLKILSFYSLLHTFQYEKKERLSWSLNVKMTLIRTMTTELGKSNVNSESRLLEKPPSETPNLKYLVKQSKAIAIVNSQSNEKAEKRVATAVSLLLIFKK